MKSYRGRPILTLRVEPGVIQSLDATAQLYGVSRADIARSMLVSEMELPRVDRIKDRLGAFRGQLALPLQEPQKPVQKVGKSPKGKKEAKRHVRAT